MNSNTKLMDLLKAMEKDCYILEGYKKLYEALQDNIREEATKSGIGTKKQLTIIKSLIAGAAKNNKMFTKAHTCKNGYAFLDGYRILVSSNNYNYEVAAENEKFNIDKIMTSEKDDLVSINIDMAILAAHIKMHNKKEKKPFIIKYNGKLISVNPYFLRDALQFTNSDKIYIDINLFKKRVYPSCIYFFNDNNSDCALLLPINTKYNDDIVPDVEINDQSEHEKKSIQEKEEAEYMEALKNEAIEENKTIIQENKKEFTRIYELIKKEINSGILKNAPENEKFKLCEKYDCFISIYEDISGLQYYENDFNRIDHINYKLHNYGYNYIGTYNNDSGCFKYRKYKVYNNLHYRVVLEALQAIEAFLADILQYKNNDLVFSNKNGILTAINNQYIYTVIKLKNGLYNGYINNDNISRESLYKFENIETWQDIYNLLNNYNLQKSA